jgi:predicted NodU family carbamoyl transferase
MNTLLLRLAPYFLIALATVGAVWWGYGVVWDRGYDQAQSEYQVKALAASESARIKEREMRDQINESEKLARQREVIIRADVDSVRTERDRLRQQLAATRNRLSTATADAVREYAHTLDDVLQQCTERLERVARAADGHASDVLTLQQAWPKSR